MRSGTGRRLDKAGTWLGHGRGLLRSRLNRHVPAWARPWRAVMGWRGNSKTRTCISARLGIFAFPGRWPTRAAISAFEGRSALAPPSGELSCPPSKNGLVLSLQEVGHKPSRGQSGKSCAKARRHSASSTLDAQSRLLGASLGLLLSFVIALRHQGLQALHCGRIGLQMSADVTLRVVGSGDV